MVYYYFDARTHIATSPGQEVEDMGADACGPVYKKLESTWRTIVKLHETPDDTAIGTAPSSKARPRLTDARYTHYRAVSCAYSYSDLAHFHFFKCVVSSYVPSLNSKSTHTYLYSWHRSSRFQPPIFLQLDEYFS